MEIRSMRCALCSLMLCLIYTMSAAYEDVDDTYMNKFITARDKASLERYYKCLVDQGPCDEFAESLKRHMAEILVTGCVNCDPEQKHAGHFLISTLKKDFPDLYEAFEEKFDPDRTLLSTLDANMKEFW